MRTITTKMPRNGESYINVRNPNKLMIFRLDAFKTGRLDQSRRQNCESGNSRKTFGNETIGKAEEWREFIIFIFEKSSFITYRMKNEEEEEKGNIITQI